MRSKTIGVMGGLGPGATAEFFVRLVRASGAKRDQDHFRILIDNDPHIADRNEAIAGRGPSPGPGLAAMARGLERSGADFLVLACNAAHHWQDEIRTAVSIPFLSMIDETVAETMRHAPRKAGVLAADACLRARLYERAFATRGIASSCLDDAQQAQFMQLLYRIKSGDLGAGVRNSMASLALALFDRGADVILAGCTEVPLVLDAANVRAPLVCSMDVLVARTVAFARGDENA